MATEEKKENLNGMGLGLRWPFLKEVQTASHPIKWFEVITENILNQKTPFFHETMRIRERFEVSLHGVSLSLGTKDVRNNYLKDLKNIVDILQPRFVSDHVCWSHLDGQYFPDLLPMAYTRENIETVVGRIQQVQDTIGRRIMVENISQYLTFKDSEMSEGEFLAEICRQADCDLLLDVNNIYVNSVNLSSPWDALLETIPVDRVKQLHIAGHDNDEGFLIDTHGTPISNEVLQILKHTYAKFGPLPTLLERDSNIPPLADLIQEMKSLQQIQDGFDV